MIYYFLNLVKLKDSLPLNPFHFKQTDNINNDASSNRHINRKSIKGSKPY